MNKTKVSCRICRSEMLKSSFKRHCSSQKHLRNQCEDDKKRQLEEDTKTMQMGPVERMKMYGDNLKARYVMRLVNPDYSRHVAGFRLHEFYYCLTCACSFGIWDKHEHDHSAEHRCGLKHARKRTDKDIIEQVAKIWDAIEQDTEDADTVVYE